MHLAFAGYYSLNPSNLESTELDDGRGDTTTLIAELDVTSEVVDVGVSA